MLTVGCSLGPLEKRQGDETSGAALPIPPAEPDAATANGVRESKVSIISAGAVVGVHEPLQDKQFAVAPTDVASERNTFRRALLPIACWGTVDARFAFDSSFIQPDMRNDIAELRKVVDANPGALLSVFGHADPTGEAEYNKTLSGRRARAVHALITRDVGVWLALSAAPVGRDNWKPVAFDTMRDTLESAGVATGPAQTALIKAYMDLLCTGDDGKVLLLQRSQFLGKGADAQGKADAQGCGEFNPVRVFSKAEVQEFAAPTQHPERDARNAPNRRVLIFLFPADTKIDVATWPCPRTSEGTAGCQKRLWSDAAKRVAPGEKTREHPTEQTFSCRFYDRLAGKSPCETIRESIAVRLYDQKGVQMPGAVYRLSLDGTILQEAKADAQGAFSVVVPGQATRALIEWGPKPAAGKKALFTFRDDLELGADPDDPNDAEACLINLGYSGGSPLDAKVTAFQQDYRASFGLIVSGILDAPTREALREVYTSDAANVRTVGRRAGG